ncbi:MAG: HD domain-containing protein [Bacteroidales bacterium]|nr:HD domain-containing protein [Bacteroidales bacterium]MCF8405898.1 HD domain-containing protein [Bacteroidales bacterium]
MEREKALELLHQYIKSPNMINHCLASEAVMKAIAIKLGRDREKWALAGLLHDLDVELVHGDMYIHGKETAKILKELNVDDEIIDAIRLHNESSAIEKRSKEFQYALAAGETITGLIVATALVYPDKKLASVKPKSVIKRMKEAKFAASVRRENIMECELIGIPLAEFCELSVNAMREIAEDIGL